MAVLSVEPIYTCLEHHGLIPSEQRLGWDGSWDDEHSHYSDDNAPVGLQYVSVSYYRGSKGQSIEVFCYNRELVDKAVGIASREFPQQAISVQEMDDKMTMAKFIDIHITEERALSVFNQIRKMFDFEGLTYLK